jgi:hypothetical protein
VSWALPRDYSRDEVIEYLDKTFEQKFNAVQMSAVFHAVRPNQDLVGPAFHELAPQSRRRNLAGGPSVPEPSGHDT